MCAKSEALKRANKRIRDLDVSYADLYESHLDLIASLIHIKETTEDIETLNFAAVVLQDNWSATH